MLTRRSMLAGFSAAIAVPAYPQTRSPDAITVPFRVSRGRVLLDIALNDGPPLSFLLDTGGIVSLIQQDVAKAASLKPIGRLQLNSVGGFGGAEPRDGYEANYITIGGIAKRGPIQFAGVDPSQLSLGASGSLDGEVIAAYDSLLSFSDQRWTIYLKGTPDPSGFHDVPSSIRQPAKHGSPFLYVDAHLNDKPTRLLVDTGAPRSLVFQSNAARRLGLIDEGRPWTPWRVRSGNLPGSMGRETRADSFDLGGQRFSRPIVSLRSNAPIGDLADGFLGLGMIQRLDWIVDHKRGKLSVRPNKNAEPRQEYNRSGLWIERDNDKVEVKAVGAGSPAAQAGIKNGDVILGQSLSELESQLRQHSGAVLALQVERGGSTFNVSVTLRDFL